MIKVRQGVFETNSSSTHSIIIIEDDDFQAWKKGEKFFIEDTGKFVDKKEAEKIKKEIRFDCLMYNISNNKDRNIEAIEEDRLIEELDESLEEDGDYILYLPMSYDKFCNIDRDLEQDYNTYTTKNGEKIHILCSYGNNY